MPTKDELEFENAELREENERLREQLAEAQAGKSNTRPVPTAPSFGISEGTRADLEQDGKATDPFTGKVLTRDDVRPAVSDGE